MKLTIDKHPGREGDKVRVELSLDAKRPPIILALTPAQIDMLTALLSTAARTDRFTLSLEL